MSRLGVTVQNLGAPEIYPALERGAIDATEWVGPYDDKKLGFYEVAKNYYYPGWWEPGPSLSFLVNQAAWDALPGTYQGILRAAGQQAAATMLEYLRTRERRDIQRSLKYVEKLAGDYALLFGASALESVVQQVLGISGRPDATEDQHSDSHRVLVLLPYTLLCDQQILSPGTRCAGR